MALEGLSRGIFRSLGLLKNKRKLDEEELREMTRSLRRALQEFVVLVHITDHASMDFVVQNLADGVGTNGLGQSIGFAVEQPSDVAKGLNAHDFAVGQFQTSDVYATELVAKLLDSLEFLQPSFLQKRVVKFRSDSVD